MTKLTHGLTYFPFGLFIALRLAPVPLLLSLGEGQFALGDALAEVDPKWHERQAFGIQFSFQFVDLFLAEEQLPRSEGSVVKWPSGEIFADMAIHEPDLAAANHSVGVPQVRLALAEGFNFGAKQHHARFQLLKKVIIV